MQNLKRPFRPPLILYLILLFAGGFTLLPLKNAYTQPLQQQKAVLLNGQTGFKITQNGSTGFHFINRLASLDVHEEGTQNGFFSLIGAEGYASTQIAGDPSLPILRKLI